MEKMTRAERALQRLLTESTKALAGRDYAKLEETLSRAALEARSLRLLGPRGADEIPVNAAEAPARVRVAGFGPSVATIVSGALVAPGYVMVEWANGGRQSVPEYLLDDVDDDAPTGAGDSVEAYRG